jgi:hypothetical protein
MFKPELGFLVAASMMVEVEKRKIRLVVLGLSGDQADRVIELCRLKSYSSFDRFFDLLDLEVRKAEMGLIDEILEMIGFQKEGLV